jgi:Flp pilus assembly protein TadD
MKRAVPFLELALEIARRIGDRRSEAAVLSDLGNANQQLGQSDQAKAIYMQALVMSRELGDR